LWIGFDALDQAGFVLDGDVAIGFKEKMEGGAFRRGFGKFGGRNSATELVFLFDDLGGDEEVDEEEKADIDEGRDV